MTTFTQFADSTKDTCMYITSGLLVIVLATFTKGLLGNITSKLVSFGGIVLLFLSLLAFGKELISYLEDKPDFFNNPKYYPFVKNTLMGCAMCCVLLATVLYATYSLFF